MTSSVVIDLCFVVIAISVSTLGIYHVWEFLSVRFGYSINSKPKATVTRPHLTLVTINKEEKEK